MLARSGNCGTVYVWHARCGPDLAMVARFMCGMPDGGQIWQWWHGLCVACQMGARSGNSGPQLAQCWPIWGPALANRIWASKGPSFFAVCGPDVSPSCGSELGQTNLLCGYLFVVPIVLQERWLTQSSTPGICCHVAISNCGF